MQSLHLAVWLAPQKTVFCKWLTRSYVAARAVKSAHVRNLFISSRIIILMQSLGCFKCHKNCLMPQTWKMLVSVIRS